MHSKTGTDWQTRASIQYICPALAQSGVPLVPPDHCTRIVKKSVPNFTQHKLREHFLPSYDDKRLFPSWSNCPAHCARLTHRRFCRHRPSPCTFDFARVTHRSDWSHGSLCVLPTTWSIPVSVPRNGFGISYYKNLMSFVFPQFRVKFIRLRSQWCEYVSKFDLDSKTSVKEM